MPQFASIAVSILFDGLAYAMFLFITVGRPFGHDGADGLRQPGAWRFRHGRRLYRRHADALARRRLRALAGHRRGHRSARSACRSSACSTAGFYKSTDLEQVLLTIGLAFMAIADLHVFLRADPEIGAAAGLAARRRQSRLPPVPELPRLPDRARRRAHRGALVRLRAHQYRRQDPRRGRQPAHGGIGRHQCRPAVHAHLRARLGACRARRRARHPAVRAVAELRGASISCCS